MATSWDSDEALVAELGEALRAEREVPARFVEIGRAAFAWHSVDAELAELTFDSATDPGALAGVRSEPSTTRAMTFPARRLTIELEVAEDALLGQIVPAQAGEIEVQLRDGSASGVSVDEVGWFVIRPRPAGLFRLRIRTVDGDEIRTLWTDLQ
jgi:hypothetical protein